ncbi:adenylosuccinate synthase [Methanosarcina acetivorans]|uniref:Adenylosuccinate synthetase 1 n=1 Tax=Methanosarcina acetivorans (strain ATCC 35395 / DSM 2834 / JCM 12185 / C2A) TaxID=188937 RepID=PURA1_METAC|nr:adenylosuccinate synthase [Methanosarcina acetivorans]Q8TPJ2.1 RecName: Full=Adenylosuccinate synthetase 1; Short=AMPSase 1; Short=AdSS 1; AltName: Full=IMP--aspartate ligase 1 [Methanosarcina acetivorans C2A]AAM05323.1 adenylosuccinate synthase [Methanosarcina acetivorans C2A]
MSVTVIVGAQCGDEGKGKMVDLIAQDYDLVIRFQGGDNAGHTVVNQYGTFKMHLIPCGIFNQNAISLVGTGMVVNPDELQKEMKQITSAGMSVDNLKISTRANILMPYHRDLDELNEQSGGMSIGTTKRGIGPAYAGRATRTNIRFGDLAHQDYLKSHFEKVLPAINHQLSFFGAAQYTVDQLCEYCSNWYKLYNEHIVDAFTLIHNMMKENKRILFEGQLGVMKDIDLGIYPFVTSSNPIAAYAAVSSGIPARSITSVIGVAKAFSSQVGDGPFPTEVLDNCIVSLRGTGKNIDDEFGARTGRPRRLGWLDIPVLRYAHTINGFDTLAICKLDKMDSLPEIKICTSYRYQDQILSVFPDTEILGQVKAEYETLPGWECTTRGVNSFDDLPENAKSYIKRIEELVGVPVKYIGVGPARSDVIIR